MTVSSPALIKRGLSVGLRAGYQEGETVQVEDPKEDRAQQCRYKALLHLAEHEKGSAAKS